MPSAPARRKPKPDDVLAGWHKRFGKDGKLMHHFAKGCPNCDDSGLRGRAGLHELLVVSRTIRHLIQTGARPDELLRTALARRPAHAAPGRHRQGLGGRDDDRGSAREQQLLKGVCAAERKPRVDGPVAVAPRYPRAGRSGRLQPRSPTAARGSSGGRGYFHLLWIHNQSVGWARTVASSLRA